MTDILGIGSSGLTAYRKLLETTGNNIANANTEGYVRRDVVLQSVGEAQMLPTAKNGGSGAGVAVDLVRRASDAFLQSQVRTAVSRQTRAEVLSQGLVRLEKSVVAPEHNIGSTVEDFFARMQDLTLSPSSASMRLTLIDAGQRVAERFRVTASSIRDEVTSTEAAMQTTIEGLNTMTAQLASLNREISRSGAGQQKLNDLLDQRDKLLKDISKLVTVTAIEKTSGEITLYLGDSPSGPKLVDFDTSKSMGMAVDGDRINFVYDPYGTGSVTNQVLGGALAGQRDFRTETLALLANVNRLALGLSEAINAQHHQGIDLKGAQGKDLFSTDGVVASPAGLNRGTAKVDITIETAAELKDDTYTLRYDKSKGEWSVRADKSGTRITGQPPLRIDGLAFHVEGEPADGDVFTAKPLADAAIGLHFLTDDPAAIAASMALYVDPASSNTGSGLLNLKRWDIPVSMPTTPPALTSLYSALMGDTLSFRRDGNAFTIPSGGKDIVLSSMGNVSAAHFAPENFIATPIGAPSSARLTVQSLGTNPATETTYSARFDGLKNEWVVTSDQTGKSARGDAVISLDGNQFIFSGVAADGDEYRVDSFSSFTKRLKEQTVLDINLSTKDTPPTLTTLTLSGLDTTPEGMAKAINAAAQKQNLGSAIFASVVNGTLTINALAGYTVNSAALKGVDANQQALTMGARIEKPMVAADMRLSTTEGRQLFTNAMAGWRAIDMDEHTKPIEIASVNSTVGRSIAIRVRGEPLRDSALKGADGSVTAGGVYALDVKGMQSIRLAGSAIVGKNHDGVTDLLAQALNDQATARSWSGGIIDFNAVVPEEAHFRITVDGEQNDITFRRSRDEAGNLISTGTFEVDGPSGLEIALNPDSNTTGHIVFTVPKRLSTTAPIVEVSGSESLALGFQDPPKARITAGGPLTGPLPKVIPLKIGDGPVTNIMINQVPGATADGLSWKMIGDRLSFETTASSTINIVSEFTADRDSAAALGFLGTDLDLSVVKDVHDMKELRLTSSAAEDVEFANASASVSRIGSTIRIHDALPEDLIVSLETTTADSLRQVATSFPQDLTRTPPKLGNISVRVIDSKSLEIIDASSGKAVATRAFIIGEPVEYLGLSFTLQAPISPNDKFDIKWDDSRTGDNRNILAMTQLQKSDMFGPKRGSFQDVYASTAAKLGNTSQSAATDESVASKASSDLQSAYDSKTGVSLDKEASDLIRFQQAYQAAAQVVSVARTMFDTILKSF